MLDPKDIESVAATKSVFTDESSATGQAFYARLFELAPDLRSMFPDDISEQSRKLSATLAVAVSALHDWEELAPILAALARRHIAYGTVPWHYAVVTRSLLDTLESAGAEPETIAAWNRTMSAISSHMIASAYGQEPEQASMIASG